MSCTSHILSARLFACTYLQAAIDQERSELAGQEVTFAKGIAAEQKEAEATHTDPRTGLTKHEIEHQLQLAAERKKHFDDERALKAGAQVQHVSVARSGCFTHLLMYVSIFRRYAR
jgi:gamma-glutamylcysteine synthetase